MTTITDTASGATPGGYGLPNSAPEGPQRLDALSACLDPITIPFLEQTGIIPVRGETGGQAKVAFLELGPGGGSILRRLLAATAGHGSVTAVDLDPSRLTPTPGLTIVNHDLTTGLPPNLGGPFTIHGRLVLVHLPNRHQLFDELVKQLALGGWLVLGEFSGRPLEVKTSPSKADATLFTTVIDAFRDILVSQHGVDLTWAHQLHGLMAEAGLEQVHSIEYAESWTGGSPGSRLHLANIEQKRDQLLAAGLTSDDLDRFVVLMDDPGFSARGWQLVYTRGRKPTR